MRDDLIQRGRVHALTQTQRHGLRRSRNVHPRQQLVDDLDLAACASRITQLVDFASHGIQKRLGHDIGGRPSGGHHGHLPARRLGSAARNRCVNIEKPHGSQPRFKRHRPIRVYCRAHHEDAARLHGGSTTRARARACTISITKQHGLGLGRIDHDRHHHVALGTQLGQ